MATVGVKGLILAMLRSLYVTCIAFNWTIYNTAL